MIVDVLVQVFVGVLQAVLGLIPTFTPFEPQAFEADYDQIAERVGNMLAIWDRFMPISAVFVVLFSLFATRVFVAMVQFVQWLWGVLPFKSS
jgi:hypothetical protein